MNNHGKTCLFVVWKIFPLGHSGSNRRVEVIRTEGVVAFRHNECPVFQRPAVVAVRVHKTLEERRFPTFLHNCKHCQEFCQHFANTE